MLRHTVLFTLTEDATDGAVDAAISALRALPDAVPSLHGLTVRRDARLADGNADLLLEAEFADADGWRTYATHPAHVRVVEERVRPIVAGRTAVQTLSDEG